MTAESEQWPSLSLAHWQESYETLHLWTQIVGKIRLSQMPWINHSWHVPLYLTARGLTTSPIPYGARVFTIEFDFVNHRLLIAVSDGAERTLPLLPQSVADFYHTLLGELANLGLPVTIHGSPNELVEAIPFAEDHKHAAYDPDYANRFWRVLVQVDRVFWQFRAGFIGKVSPVHFFWGSFDLAVTRFSGRLAPTHPGGIPNLPDWVVREAYSHEVSSAGFWPGGGPHPFPLFYSYAYPEPAGFAQAKVQPEGAFYSSDLREFILPYEVVRQADAPDTALLMFLESTYRAAADLGAWNRVALERAEEPHPAGN
jgi:hypothetical protein